MILGHLAILGEVEQGNLSILPFVKAKMVKFGMSYGLSEAGYDVRLAQPLTMYLGAFLHGSVLENIGLPTHLMAFVHDKSTLARQGISVQNTVIEPGWHGHITLELANHSHDMIYLKKGQPIAQLVFHEVRGALSYEGKYQGQGGAPVKAILEQDT